MLQGANAFEISDIREDETEASPPDDQNVTMLHSLEHRWWNFLRSTGTQRAGKSMRFASQHVLSLP
jgi:hypothetical protein